jgi:hypothetical protein
MGIEFDALSVDQSSMAKSPALCAIVVAQDLNAELASCEAQLFLGEFALARVYYGTEGHGVVCEDIGEVIHCDAKVLRDVTALSPPSPLFCVVPQQVGHLQNRTGLLD